LRPLRSFPCQPTRFPLSTLHSKRNESCHSPPWERRQHVHVVIAGVPSTSSPCVPSMTVTAMAMATCAALWRNSTTCTLLACWRRSDSWGQTSRQGVSPQLPNHLFDVVDHDRELAAAEDPLGGVAPPGSRQEQIDWHTAESGHLPEPRSGGGAGVLRPAKACETRTAGGARLKEWHDGTMVGRPSTSRATSVNPASGRADRSTGIDAQSADMLD